MAMKKRPSKGPISTTCPDTPSSVWRAMMCPQIAAAKRDDMPGTRA